MEWDTPFIRQLDECFRQDPDVNEIGIIFNIPPPSGKTNPDPNGTRAPDEGNEEPQFILQQHKLGISVHIVHPLINEARRAFPVARNFFLRTRCLSDGDNSGPAVRARATGDNACSLDNGSSSAIPAAERLLSVTRALLLVNADHLSAWNARKQVVQDGLHGSVEDEIKLLDLIFTKHSKSPNAWAHRRWCWRNDKRLGPKLGSRWRQLTVQKELEVCERVAELYPKNYYAWTQRSWVVLREVESATTGGGGDASAKERGAGLLGNEIAFVDKWLTRHVSDHSALNHRKNLASALPGVSSGHRLVRREMSSNSTLVKDYPGHESLWCYRRHAFQTFLVSTPPNVLLDGEPTGSCSSWTSQPRRKGDPSSIGGGHQNGVNPEVAKEGDVSSGDDIGGGTGNGVSPVATPGRCSPDGDGKRTNSVSVDPCDWTSLNRAAVDFHDALVEEDLCDSAEDEVDATYDPDEEDQDSEEPETPPGLAGVSRAQGSMADLLVREVQFALKCATDKGVWQFRQQRRYALSYLSFITFAADRVCRLMERGYLQMGNDNHANGEKEPVASIPAGSTEVPAKDDVRDDSGRRIGWKTSEVDCLRYCEVIGPPRLRFPLESEMGEKVQESSRGPAGFPKRSGQVSSQWGGVLSEGGDDELDVGRYPRDFAARCRSAVQGLRLLNSSFVQLVVESCSNERKYQRVQDSVSMDGGIVTYILNEALEVPP